MASTSGSPRNRKFELVGWFGQHEERQAAVGALPGRVHSFLEYMQALGTRQAKALLETFLSAADV